MHQNEPKNNHSFEYYTDLASQYDQLGLYHLADQIFNWLKQYESQIGTEGRMRINKRSNNIPQSMSSTEETRGYDAVRYNPRAYMSGKGQAAYRDNIPMNMEFV